MHRAWQWQAVVASTLAEPLRGGARQTGRFAILPPQFRKNPSSLPRPRLFASQTPCRSSLVFLLAKTAGPCHPGYLKAALRDRQLLAGMRPGRPQPGRFVRGLWCPTAVGSTTDLLRWDARDEADSLRCFLSCNLRPKSSHLPDGINFGPPQRTLV